MLQYIRKRVLFLWTLILIVSGAVSPLLACTESSLKQTENDLRAFIFTDVTFEYTMIPRSAIGDWRIFVRPEELLRAGRRFSNRESFLPAFLEWCKHEDRDYPRENEPVLFATNANGWLFAWSYLAWNSKDWQFWLSNIDDDDRVVQFWQRSRMTSIDGFLFNVDYTRARLRETDAGKSYLIIDRQYQGDRCDRGDQNLIGYFCRTDRAFRVRLQDNEITRVEAFDQENDQIFYVILPQGSSPPDHFLPCLENGHVNIQESDTRGYGSPLPRPVQVFIEKGQCYRLPDAVPY
jgi:hypothetical protein